ncbi:hypothetical protein EDM68_04025 [Candidatus Uhrbacteria bacterium]|nr:MAG: hypothetical protein EDM68_04025 [Candidatus Uhrbacteria bacterium]
MPYLFIRLLPWLVGVAGFAAAEWTWRHPNDYPWALVGVLAAYAASAITLGWKRLSTRDLSAKMLTPAVTFVALALASLLAEQPGERLALTLLLAIVPGYALELLFLLAHQPTRYPVNGLSRLNLALVPLAAFCFAVGLVGMQIFIQLPKWITLGAFTGVGALLSFLTEHPSVERAVRVRWTAFGALLGLQVGMLAIVLPVGLEVIGALAAIAFAWPLRARRYGYEPKPPRSLAVAESAGAMVLFLAILLVSRWG